MGNAMQPFPTVLSHESRVLSEIHLQLGCCFPSYTRRMTIIAIRIASAKTSPSISHPHQWSMFGGALCNLLSAAFSWVGVEALVDTGAEEGCDSA